MAQPAPKMLGTGTVPAGGRDPEEEQQLERDSMVLELVLE